MAPTAQIRDRPEGPVLRHDWPGRTFNDATLDEVLRVQGYVTFPVLDADEVAAIRTTRERIVGDAGSGMAVDYMLEDRTAIAAINDLLEGVWARHFDEIFADHRPAFSTCVVKHPGPDSAMFLHDDRSFVDERVTRSGTMWIPLVDTGPGIDNGGLQVVPGSHRLGVTFAGSNTPDLMRPYEAALESALVAPPVPAGTALFYDSRVLHASPPNRTDRPRPALACSVVPRDASLIHVRGIDARRRRVYAVDEAFFLELRPEDVEREMPARYPVIEEFDDAVEGLDPELVRDACGLDTAPFPESILPEDLRGEFDGTAAGPPPEAPRRIGALSATGRPRADVVGPAPRSGGPGPAEQTGWVPTSLWPDRRLRWSVGDPRARLIDDEPTTLALTLAPRERVCLDLSDGAEARIHTVAAPAVGAGVVAQDRALPCETGTSTQLSGVDHGVFWNHGPGDLEVLAELTHPRRDWRSGLRGRRQRRRLDALAREVRAAVG